MLGESVSTQARRRIKLRTIMAQQNFELEQKSFFLSKHLFELQCSKSQSTFKSHTYEQIVDAIAKVSQAAKIFLLTDVQRQESIRVMSEKTYLRELKNYNQKRNFFLSKPCRAHCMIRQDRMMVAQIKTPNLAGCLQTFTQDTSSLKFVLEQQQIVYSKSSKGIISETNWSVAQAIANDTPINGETAIFRNSFMVQTRPWNLKKGNGLNIRKSSIPHTINARYCTGMKITISSPKLRAYIENRMANKVDRNPAILNIEVEFEQLLSSKSITFLYEIMKNSKQATSMANTQIQKIINAMPLQGGKSLLNVGSFSTVLLCQSNRILMKIMMVRKIPTHRPKTNESVFEASSSSLILRMQSRFTFFFFFFDLASNALVKSTQKFSILSIRSLIYFGYKMFSRTGLGVLTSFWLYFLCFFNIFLSASILDASIFFKKELSMQVYSVYRISNLVFSSLLAIFSY